MEKCSNIIKIYVENCLTNLETTNSEEIILDMAKDLKYNLFFKLILEEIVIVCIEKKILLNSFYILKSISRNSVQRLYPEFIQQVRPQEVPNKESVELFNNITLFKGSLLTMLENMNLVETRAHLIKSLVFNEREINANLIYSDSEINAFDPDEFETILKHELDEKYVGKPIIIKNNQR